MVREAHASFNVFPVTRNMPSAATMQIFMNIQEENSARYFPVQSEREQALISNIPKYRGYVDKAKKGEIEWINHAIQLLLEEKLVNDDCLSWSSFHATLLNITEGLPALIALLPRQHTNKCRCKAAGLSCTFILIRCASL